MTHSHGHPEKPHKHICMGVDGVKNIILESALNIFCRKKKASSLIPSGQVLVFIKSGILTYPGLLKSKALSNFTFCRAVSGNKPPSAMWLV